MRRIRLAQRFVPYLAIALGACTRGSEHGNAAHGGSGAATRAPNLILIVVDDWARSDSQMSRADGNPWNDLIAIDALAAQGQEWENFYAQPLCNPTRRTLTFGNYTGTGGTLVCKGWGQQQPPVPATLAGELRKLGYETAAFGKWHIDPSSSPNKGWWEAPFEFGFDAWRALNGANVGGHCNSRDYFDWTRADDGVLTATNQYHTEAVALAFMDWWQETSRPRFAYVCFQASHLPLHAPPSYLLPSGYPTPKNAREQYEAMLVAMDTLVGTMLSIVDLRDTFVFLVGDNGTPPEALRPGQDASRVKWTTYEDGVNVPMIAVGPDIRPGTTPALGHVVDFPGTLLELAGGAASATMEDTVSLVPVLRNPASRVRRCLICDREPTKDPRFRDHDTCAVLEAPGVLFKARYDTPPSRPTRKTYYDLIADPVEEHPISAKDPSWAAWIGEADAALGAYGVGGDSSGGAHPKR